MSRKRRTKAQMEESREIIIDMHYDMDIIFIEREKDGLFHPVNIIDQLLNKRYADGWEYIDKINLGNDYSKSEQPPVLGLLFKKIN